MKKKHLEMDNSEKETVNKSDIAANTVSKSDIAINKSGIAVNMVILGAEGRFVYTWLCSVANQLCIIY